MKKEDFINEYKSLKDKAHKGDIDDMQKYIRFYTKNKPLVDIIETENRFIKCKDLFRKNENDFLKGFIKIVDNKRKNIGLNELNTVLEEKLYTEVKNCTCGDFNNYFDHLGLKFFNVLYHDE